MRHPLNMIVLFALALLLVSPCAWGCDSSGMKGCDMSERPMSEEQGSSHCEQDDDEPMDCGGQKTVSVDCCDAPADRSVAEIAPSSVSVSRLDLPTAGTTGIQSEAPPPLPVDATCVIRTQQHELGRFTMLSSYLL